MPDQQPHWTPFHAALLFFVVACWATLVLIFKELAVPDTIEGNIPGASEQPSVQRQSGESDQDFAERYRSEVIRVGGEAGDQ